MRRLAALPNEDLRRQMRSLSEEWLARGCPDEEEMPRQMLQRFHELRAEADRRGVQMHLF